VREVVVVRPRDPLTLNGAPPLAELVDEQLTRQSIAVAARPASRPSLPEEGDDVPDQRRPLEDSLARPGRGDRRYPSARPQPTRTKPPRASRGIGLTRVPVRPSTQGTRAVAKTFIPSFSPIDGPQAQDYISSEYEKNTIWQEAWWWATAGSASELS
jgi:hypothetical protein